MLKPTLRVHSVAEISPELLRRHGIEGVMIDLDDTLVAAKAERLEPRFKTWLNTLKGAGFAILLLSNGSPERVRRWAHELGLDAFALVGKPWPWAFRKGLRQLGTAPHRTAMIGDQLFTDVLGANWAGLMSILVTPLSVGALPHTRALRHLERLILGGEHGRSVDR
jgi:HAD superfamily phosphatase (TIGR01668 family)